MTDEPKPRRTGTIVRYTAPKPGEKLGHYVVRCSAPDGSRPIFHLEPSPKSEEDRAEALKTSTEISADLWARGLGAAKRRPRQQSDSTDEEAEAWCREWLADRKRRGIVRDVSNDISEYIAPATGYKHVKDWTPEDMRAICQTLDRKVQEGELAWKTATNIWGTATRMCRDACRSKVEALRVRSDNPATGVEGPDRGARKGKQYLYPSEFLRFVECEAVPLRWRRAAALAVYLFPRAAELRALSLADDMSLEHGTVHIHRSLDGAGKAKPTKSRVPRRFAIEPALLPLLRAMTREGLTHCEMPTKPQNLSSSLRNMLRRAGVTRAELHETTATRKALTFHDLRATGITWMAVRGDDPLKIMQRAGHTDFNTTQIYIREAEAVREGFGDVFPTLPRSLRGPTDDGPDGGAEPPEPAPSEEPDPAVTGALSQVLSQSPQVHEMIVRRRGLEPPRVLPH